MRPDPTGSVARAAVASDSRQAGDGADDAPAYGRPVDAIVIGASAGGVEALMRILTAFTPRLSVPVFVVIHLPRDRPSLLAKIFSVHCSVPVREAEDKMPAEPGTLYFAPPDYHLLLERGPSLALSADEAVNYSRPSIDVLFESAIDVYGARVAGVVLTGANHDGAAGLAAIGRAGGVTIVQDPETALAKAMPTAALRSTDVDFVLPLDGIRGLLQMLDGAMDRRPQK